MNDIIKKSFKELDVSKKYSYMLDEISNSMPSIMMDTESFYKSSSQFKTATLDVIDLTPISSARHILASINNTRMALEDAEISLKRKTLEAKKIKKLMENCDEYEYESNSIDLEEVYKNISNLESNVRGAIRKIHFLIEEYKKILNHLGKEYITEEDYEADQAKYHIMTAFYQALCAARSRGGLIDEGNHIYLSQLGINGSMAQAEVSSLISLEQELMNKGIAPTHDMVIDWLNKCAEKYIDNPEKYIKDRGMLIFNEKSIVELNK
jgi:hypothetical protein